MADRKPRKKPKQGRSKALVDAVVAAVEELSAEQGVRKVTIAGIARRSGVSLASVYEYFPTKDAVFAAWAETAWERGLAAGFAALQDGLIVRQLHVDVGIGEIVVAVNACLRPFACARADLGFHHTLGRSERRSEIYDAVCQIIEGAILSQPDVTGVSVRSPRLAARLLATLLCADSYMAFLASGDDEAADAEVTDLFRRYLGGGSRKA